MRTSDANLGRLVISGVIHNAMYLFVLTVLILVGYVKVV